jgi:hypothetical protein
MIVHSSSFSNFVLKFPLQPCKFNSNNLYQYKNLSITVIYNYCARPLILWKGDLSDYRHYTGINMEINGIDFWIIKNVKVLNPSEKKKYIVACFIKIFFFFSFFNE